VIVRPEAERDIAEASDYYESQRTGLGDAFEAAVEVVFRQVERMPELHQVVFKTVRRAALKRFPYAVFYCIQDGDVVVIAVSHGRRDPGRWKSRL
jgi:plasmid stabilization system protein ParE